MSVSSGIGLPGCPGPKAVKWLCVCVVILLKVIIDHKLLSFNLFVYQTLFVIQTNFTEKELIKVTSYQDNLAWKNIFVWLVF